MADLAVWQRTIVDEKGNVIPGAEVSVRSYPGGSLITLYEGPDGTQVKGNPFSTGTDGFARFWAESQRAEIIAHGAGSTIRWVVDLINADEVIGDAVSEATAAAAVAVGEAEAAADRAEAARDAAQLNAHIYPNTAAGLAATTDGDYFSVPSGDSDEYLILYRNDSGTAAEVSRTPSSYAISTLIGTATLATDWDSVNRSGFYRGAAAAGETVGVPEDLPQLRLWHLESALGRASQMAFSQHDTNPQVWVRSRSTLGWGDWQELINRPSLEQALGDLLKSPELSGVPTAPPAAFDADQAQIANINTVLRWTRSYLSRNVASHTDGVYTLTEVEAYYPVVNLTGALTQDVVVEVPVTTPSLSRIFRNATSGGHKVIVCHTGQTNLRVEIEPGEAVPTISSGNFILEVGRNIPEPPPPEGWPIEVVALVSETQVEIYMPSGEPGGDRYFLYPFVRSVNVERGCDVWRWQRCYEATRTGAAAFTIGQEVITNGENETAIQIAGKSDFMGGLAHGDELHTSITMLIDGMERPIANGATYRARRIEFLQSSELFEPDTDPPQTVRAAKAYKRWVFEGSHVDIEQYIVWDQAYELTKTYLAMCAALRTSGSTQITDTGYRSPTWEAEDVSSPGFPQVNTQSSIIKLSGPEYSVSVEILDGWDDPGRTATISPAEAYNKLYFNFYGSGHMTAPGEGMISKARYRIDGRGISG